MTNTELRKEKMFRLRAEMKALSGWDQETALFQTQTEMEAVILHHLRRREITAILKDLAARN